MQETEKIWMNGELVDWADATVHVGVHGLHYGTGVFEGIRAYETPKGPSVFRLADHLQRLHDEREAPLHGDPVLRRGAPDRRRTSSCARTASRPATSGRSPSSATARSACTRAGTRSRP